MEIDLNDAIIIPNCTGMSANEAVGHLAMEYALVEGERRRLADENAQLREIIALLRQQNALLKG